MADGELKPVDWIGSSYKDFRAFPNEVQDHMGYALYLAPTGDKHEHAKPLKGFGGAGVLEIVSDDLGDTYRGVYKMNSPLRFMCCTRFKRSLRQAARLRPSTWK